MAYHFFPNHLWSALGEEERDQLSRRNFNHFLKRWGNRKDLLLANAHH